MAAEQGVPEAQFTLAEMYEKGLGGGVAPAGAKLGSTSGNMISIGTAAVGTAAVGTAVGASAGVAGGSSAFPRIKNGSIAPGIGAGAEEGAASSPDMAKAAEWFLKAAEQGDAKAQHILGGMYEKGYGVRKDAARAREWHSKACSRGLRDGCDAYKRLISDW